MPRFILAGHQRGLAKLVEEAVESAKVAGRLCGWESCLLHSRLQNQSILQDIQIPNVLEEAGKADGGHVFGVSVDRRRSDVERLVKPYFRFRWIDQTAIAMAGQRNFDPLIAALERAVAEEQAWIEHVKPTSPASPLALPAKLFKANGEFATLWACCEAYGDLNAIRAAGAMVMKFTGVFRKTIDSTKNEKTPWVDHNDWVWKDDGEQHGAAAFPKNWKYSWAVPERFHFDVMPRDAKKKTHFIDVNGVNHKLPKDSKYMNVTVHGEVRGYKGTA